IIEINILNRRIGNENGMLYSSEITGVVCTVVVMLLRSIINDMQKEISVRNQSNGLCQFANHVMTNNIVDRTFPSTKLIRRQRFIA
ncbi:MAG: hypothetical protein RIA63_06025, partial [Cyclobacteriaceae bacterium]